MQTRVIKDMNKYTSNLFMGLNGRQTVLTILGVLAIGAGYLLLPIPDVLAVLVGIPFFLMAFYKPEGISLEKYVFYFIESNFRNTRTRYYERDSEIYQLLWGEKGRRYREVRKNEESK